MNHVSFGSLLREARIKKGYEVNTVSRRLRIRPDIIKAIEDSDFERMPARGYARNMVNAYAKLVGLNPNTITRMYLDEIYAYQIGQAHNEADISRSMQRVTANTSARRSSSRRQVDTYDDGYPRTNRRGSYNQDDSRLGQSLYSQDQMHRSRRPVMSEGQYLNAVAGGSGRGGREGLLTPRNIIIAVVALLLLALVIFGVSRCAAGQNNDQQNIPVTGANDTTKQTEQGGENTTAEVAPTNFKLDYNLAEGNSTYIEVYVDGATKEAHDVSGPANAEYTSSDNIRFVCTNTSGLTVNVNGEAQELKANSNGIVTLDVKFQDILDKWYQDHPNAQRPNSSSSNSSGSSSSSDNNSTSGSSNSSNSNSSSTSGNSNSSGNSSSSSDNSDSSTSSSSSDSSSNGSSGTSSGGTNSASNSSSGDSNNNQGSSSSSNSSSSRND